jgi:hypothetical protein
VVFVFASADHSTPTRVKRVGIFKRHKELHLLGDYAMQWNRSAR